MLRRTVAVHLALAHCVQRHARVLYVLVVCCSKRLRSGALHRVSAGGGVTVAAAAAAAAAGVVVGGGGSLRAVRQDGGSAMHWGR